MLLVNPEDDQYDAIEFLQEANAELPCLLDDADIYSSYPRQGAYAPFPVHVLIDGDGVIQYLSFQYEPQSAHAAIERVLAE